jgi:MutS domain V
MALLGPDTVPKDSPTQPQYPEREYSRRLEVLRELQTRQKRQDSRLGYLMLVLAIAGLIIAFWILTVQPPLIYLVLLPALLFVYFAVLHERVIRELLRSSRAIAFYERGLARIGGQWAGKGETGERFSDASHPYSRDLDLFGKGSLFELLCNARTRAGEETLAKWLLEAASPEEVRLRHASVDDLRGRLDFREDLAVLGEDVRSTIKPELLAAWGEKTSLLESKSIRIVVALLASLWVFGVVAWAVWDVRYIALITSLVNIGVSYKFRERTRESASSIEEAAHDLRLLSRVLARLEQESFSAPKLLRLQASFRREGLPASRCIARLNRRVESLRSRRGHVVSFFDPFVLWSLQWCFAIDAWRRSHGLSIRCWLAAIGELEALSDLAGYSFEHPADVFPEFTEDGPWFEAEAFAHPLLPESRAVRNDLRLNHEFHLMVVSGPNMAGKSTFVRSVGVNAVLAQCGATVRARRLRLSRLAVGASVCVLDSLQGGISRFYAEIARLKLIVDLTHGPMPILFLLDELLQGTNSHDRRIGAEAIARSLLDHDAIGLITTHDLALAEIAESLRPRAANFHFEDRLENGKLHFDYRLSPGIVQTSNALDLMRSIGLDV